MKETKAKMREGRGWKLETEAGIPVRFPQRLLSCTVYAPNALQIWRLFLASSHHGDFSSWILTNVWPL